MTHDFFLVWGQGLFSFFSFLYFWHGSVSRTFGTKRWGFNWFIPVSLAVASVCHYQWVLNQKKKKKNFLVNNLRSSCISSVLHCASFQGWYPQQDSPFFLWLHWGKRKKMDLMWPGDNCVPEYFSWEKLSARSQDLCPEFPPWFTHAIFSGFCPSYIEMFQA